MEAGIVLICLQRHCSKGPFLHSQEKTLWTPCLSRTKKDTRKWQPGGCPNGPRRLGLKKFVSLELQLSAESLPLNDVEWISWVQKVFGTFVQIFATTESSKCNIVPLVRAGPAFQHKSWAKEEGVWTLHSCQHFQKKPAANIIEPISLQKDRLLLENNWNKSKEMAEQQVLTKWCLFWGSGSKHASKTKQNSYSEKNRNQHPGKIYLGTKCGGAAKSWLVYKTLPCCMEVF